jgi:hypothetical protein
VHRSAATKEKGRHKVVACTCGYVRGGVIFGPIISTSFKKSAPVPIPHAGNVRLVQKSVKGPQKDAIKVQDVNDHQKDAKRCISRGKGVRSACCSIKGSKHSKNLNSMQAKVEDAHAKVSVRLRAVLGTGPAAPQAIVAVVRAYL